MELVYLWVEEYKNIEKQGFNFSPKFTCKYDEDTKILTIDKNDDYIENFFGDNINVTAIVGKNGSGKSSISEILSTFSYMEFIDEKTFFVYLVGDKFLCKQSYTGTEFSFKILNNTNYTFSKFNTGRRVNTLYFGNEISSIFNSPKYSSMKRYAGNINAYHSNDTNLMHNNTDNEIEIFNKRFVNILKKYHKLLLAINDKIKFDMYRNELHLYELGVYIVDNKDFLELLDIDELKSNTIFDHIEREDSHLYKLLILFRVINLEDNDTKKEVINEIKTIYRKDDLSQKEMMNIHSKINEYDKKETIFSEENIQNIVSSFKYLEDEIWVEKEGHSIFGKNILNNELLKLLYSSINRVNFFHSKKEGFDFYSLSSGEREYIKIFVSYIYYLDLLIKNPNLVNEKRIFIFDEPDLGLHPNWQKQIFYDFIYVAKQILNKNIHVLITSHSPFLLSDIPKQNIIFLEKDKKGNCKVVNGLKEKKQTFGANIHTLLSDSFFMEDGLMGEFAKGKIDKAIALLNKDKLDEKDLKYCEQIISIIGEPIVKNQLQRMLDSKRLKKVDEIDAIKRSMGVMQKRLDELEK